MKHTLRMLAGCVLPWLLIFILPLLGISEGITLFVAIVLMFACHLLMVGGHHHDDDETQHEEGNRHAHT